MKHKEKSMQKQILKLYGLGSNPVVLDEPCVSPSPYVMESKDLNWA